VLVGLLAAESGEAVTLRRAEDAEETVPRMKPLLQKSDGFSLRPLE
jgi:hypothetical protein